MKKPNLNKITLTNLAPEEIDQFVNIEFEAFNEMISSIYSNNLEAAFEIRKNEISNNLKTSQYFIAKIEEKIIGTIEIITSRSIREYKNNFKIYLKKLGFLKAIRAYFLSSMSPFKMTDETVYIDTVAILKDFRGKGIARKMLSLTEEKAKKMRKKSLTLWVAEENTPAYNLYKSFGFKEIVKRSSPIAEKIFKHRTWIYMKKEIT